MVNPQMHRCEVIWQLLHLRAGVERILATPAKVPVKLSEADHGLRVAFKNLENIPGWAKGAIGYNRPSWLVLC